MPRKTHTKSRNGCTECKRRHIKCDENRPRCVNCNTGNLQCIFLTSGPSRSARHATPAHHPSPTVHGSETTMPRSVQSGDTRRIQLRLPSQDAEHVLNLDHIEFLHHFCTITYVTLTPEPAQQQLWQCTAIKIGLFYPFVMHQILAIAALHLGHCDPQRREYCSLKATELQTQALKGFSEMQHQVDASSCGAMFLFSSLLALHVLADPTRSKDLSFYDYLDHFISCINLLRGVCQLVFDDWYPSLVESELKPLFQLEIQRPEPPYDNIPEECRALAQLTQNQNLAPARISAYDRAIHSLQFGYALSGVPSQSHSTIRWLLAWPLQLREDYVELLNERQPEALIILAYFGAMLHFYRESWVVGDSGVLLVRAIRAHVGSHWERWLAWPMGLCQ